MRVAWVAILGMAVSTSSAGAADGPAKVDAADLVGVWEVTKSARTPPGSTMEFTSSGSIKSKMKGTDNVFEAKYKVEGDQLTMDPPGFAVTIKELTKARLVIAGLGDTVEYKRQGAAGGSAMPKAGQRPGGMTVGARTKAAGPASGGRGKIDPADLVGIWEITKSARTPAGSTMEFTADGSVKSKMKGTDNVFEAKYKVEGDQLTMDPPGFAVTIKELSKTRLVVSGLGDTIEHKRQGAVGDAAMPKAGQRPGGVTFGGQQRKSAGPAGWQTVSSKEGGFTVQMPGAPGGHQDEAAGGFDLHMLLYRGRSTEFLALSIRGETEIPKEAEPQVDSRLRSRAIESFGTKHTVDSERPITLPEFEGREFTMTIEDSRGQARKGRGRTFTLGKSAFIVLAVANDPGKEPTVDVDRFLDSFVPRADAGAATADAAPKTKARMPRGEAVKAAGIVAEWGTPVDPDGDVSFEPSARTLTIRIPASPHVLSEEIDKFNAPRMVTPMSGDFAASVRVDGAFQPNRKSTTDKISSRQAGGLILWKDSKNYLILQRRTIVGGQGKLNHQVIFDEHKAGRRGATRTLDAPNGAISLRLERSKGHITASFSGGGKEWTAIQPIDAEWADGPLDFGVMGVNTSAEPHVIKFDHFTVKPK